MKYLLTAPLFGALISCATPYSQQLREMSEAELAVYNADLPESRRVVCIELRRAVTLTRRVCSANAARLERLAGGSGARDWFDGLSFRAYAPWDGRNEFRGRGGAPLFHFSPPPPGYDRPVIHVRGTRDTNKIVN